jgi:hypothetical protein
MWRLVRHRALFPYLQELSLVPRHPTHSTSPYKNSSSNPEPRFVSSLSTDNALLLQRRDTTPTAAAPITAGAFDKADSNTQSPAKDLHYAALLPVKDAKVGRRDT